MPYENPTFDEKPNYESIHVPLKLEGTGGTTFFVDLIFKNLANKTIRYIGFGAEQETQFEINCIDYDNQGIDHSASPKVEMKPKVKGGGTWNTPKDWKVHMSVPLEIKFTNLTTSDSEILLEIYATES